MGEERRGIEIYIYGLLFCMIIDKFNKIFSILGRKIILCMY